MAKTGQFLPRANPHDDFDDEIEDGEINQRPPTEEENELFALLEEFSGHDPQSELKVYRVKEPGPNTRGQLPLAYLFSFSPGQLNARSLMDHVRDEYGPGNYEAHIYVPHPQTRRLTRARNLKFEIGVTRDEIEETSIPFMRRKRGRGDSTTDLITSLAQVMEAQQRRTEELMRQVLERQNPTPVDPFNMMQQMVAMMASLQQLMPQPQSGFIDELQKFAMIKEIMGDLGGDGGEVNEMGVFAKLIDKFAPVLTGAMGQPQFPQPQPQPGQVSVTTLPHAQTLPQSPRQIPTAKPNPSPRATSQENDEMKGNVDALVSYAKMGVPAVYVAQQVLDRTPEADEEKLLEFISNPKCLEIMAALNPEVLSRREWFKELRDTILAAFEEVPEESGDVTERLLESHDDATLADDTSTAGDGEAGTTS